jgi:hypothetical protein
MEPPSLSPTIRQLEETQPPIEKPFDIFFSHDPFDTTLEVSIPIKGDHPTLGMLKAYCE